MSQDGCGRGAVCRPPRPAASSLRAFYLLLVSFHLNFTFVRAQGSFFRSLFDVPLHCNGEDLGVAECTFVLSCYFDGGAPRTPCGGGFLYTCCEKPVATVRSDVSNDIASFHFFREPSAFHRTKFRAYSRNQPPARPQPRVHSRFTHQQNFVPVRGNHVGNGDYPSRYRLSSREEPRVLEQKRYYNEPQCGVQLTKQFSKRIIGGNEAQFAELPWQAHIRISGYQCGGVLLNRFYVATAAHCVHKARLEQITIHLGEYDTKDTGDYFEPFPKETFAVVEKRTHPRFKYMLTQPDRYDVAVLRLSHPATYQQNIIPICLPSPNDDFEDTVGIVAGWGKTDTSFGKTGTNILRKVMVPVINNKECLRWHHMKGIDVKLHHEMFCAGHSEGKMDACLGDSGGPLVIHHRGRWRLAGITSAGFGCAVDHQPGIYHKVSVTAGWIADNIRP